MGASPSSPCLWAAVRVWVSARPCVLAWPALFWPSRSRVVVLTEFMRSGHIWWHWRPSSALPVTPCQGWMWPECRLGCVIIKPALAHAGVGVVRGIHGPPLRCSKRATKRAVAGRTKVLMPEGLTRRRRYVTSCGFGLLLGVMYVTGMMDDFQIFPIISYL